MGGWPAMVRTGRRIGHKTRKLSFRLEMALAIAINLAMVAAAIWVYVVAR